jgi:hypothetical protein
VVDDDAEQGQDAICGEKDVRLSDQQLRVLEQYIGRKLGALNEGAAPVPDVEVRP